MNKKTFTDFANYLEAFTQRIVEKYPETVNFIEDEKRIMLERFLQLVVNTSGT